MEKLIRSVVVTHAALFVSLACIVPCSGQEARLLRWKFQPGQTLALRIDQRLVQQAESDGKPLHSTIELGLELGWRVDEVEENGAAAVTQSIDRVQVSIDAPPSAKLIYDSAEEKQTTAFAKSVHEAIAPFLGAKVQQKISPRGECLAIEKVEAAGAGPPTAAAVEMLSKENLDRLLSQMAVVLPEAAVKAGDSWKRQRDVPGPAGNTLVNDVYTYAGVEDSLDRIDVNSELVAPAKIKGRPSLKIVDQQTSGSITFDTAVGRITTSEMKSSATIESTLADETVTSKMTFTSRLAVTVTE